MSFLRPGALHLLWLVPAAALLVIRGRMRRERSLRGYACPIAAAGKGSRPGWGGLAASDLLVPGAVLLLVLALAGPLVGLTDRVVRDRGIDVIVAIDGSRSMLARDVPPDRIGRAKEEVSGLLDRLAGHRVGLVVFGGKARLQCPLTLDHEGLRTFLGSITPESVPPGGTDLSRALEAALGAFDPRSGAGRAVVLVTDGEITRGSIGSGDIAKAREAGVRVFALGVGTPQGSPVLLPGGAFLRDREGNVVISRLRETPLRALAEGTGGGYVRASPGDRDTRVLAGDILGRVRPGERGERVIRVRADRYRWPLALAVLCMVLRPLLRRRTTCLVVLAGVLAAAGTPDRARADPAAELVGRGLARYRQGDYAAARDLFLRALEHRPGSPEIEFDLGVACYRLGELAAARERFTRAARSAPTQRLRAWALYNRGNTAYRMGRFREAAADYEAVLRIDPADRDARANLELVRRRMSAPGARPPPAPGSPANRGAGTSARKRGEPPGAGSDRAREGTAPDTGSPHRPARAPGSPKAAAAPPGAAFRGTPERGDRAGKPSRAWALQMLERLPEGALGPPPGPGRAGAREDPGW